MVKCHCRKEIDERERAELGCGIYSKLERTKEEEELWSKFTPAWERYWEGMKKAEAMAKEY